MIKLNRRDAISTLVLGIASAAFGGKLMSNSNDSNVKMPALFLGHGSPMNAIETNNFTQTLTNLGASLPRPKAILMISAHWETNGTWVTGMERPKTIHDFYGFPKALFDVQYPAPGSPEFAKKISSTILSPKIEIDENHWGLDHGTWSVLKHMFPEADIPVFQMSLDKTKPIEFHLELGKKLNFLREQGVMIIGSGNIVHNLRQVRWEQEAKPFDWAIEFDEWIKQKIINRDFNSLAKDALSTTAGKLSIPTLEHYLPLLYIAGASENKDLLKFEYEGIQMGSMSMRCLRFF